MGGKKEHADAGDIEVILVSPVFIDGNRKEMFCKGKTAKAFSLFEKVPLIFASARRF